MIAIVILGVIATFTIPKVLQSQQETKYKSMAKEVAGMVSGAYQHYTLQRGYKINTHMYDLTPYMNYIALTSTATIDARQTEATVDCNSGNWRCLKLHNGGMLRVHTGLSFDCATAECAVFFSFDPDGVVTNGGDTSASATGKSIQFWLYYDGKLRTAGTRLPATTCGGTPYPTPAPQFDPPWFGWD